MAYNGSKEELIKKYRLAGKIRFITFSLLLLFLLLMKFIGGHSYLNPAFMAVIFVEAVLNQPHKFLINRVNIHRFQFYQMITDIIAISWILYYMGGMEAPVISIAYYGVILWAGVVSTTSAVFFAVGASVLFFSSIVILEHFGFLPLMSFYDYKMPTSQMVSLLITNVSFLFAFGYFSANASKLVQFLQRKKQEESLRNVHKLIATGHLVGRTAHDLLNNLTNAEGYTKILLDQAIDDTEKREMLKAIEKLQRQSVDLVNRLGKFSQKSEEESKPTNIHKAIEAALELTNPILRYSRLEVKKIFDAHIPLITASGDELQEVFLVFILNSLDAVPKEGKLTIRTEYAEGGKTVKIVFSDTGSGIKREDLKRIGEPFFTTKGQGEGLGLGLATAYGIIDRHNGRIDVESAAGEGATFIIQLPAMQKEAKL